MRTISLLQVFRIEWFREIGIQMVERERERERERDNSGRHNRVIEKIQFEEHSRG
jgi:hypothetical protein